MASIWSDLVNIPDRQTGNAQKHKLLDLLTLICGAESCVDFADFARHREALFREFLEFPGGPPSHDTLSSVFRLLDPGGVGSLLRELPRRPRRRRLRRCRQHRGNPVRPGRMVER
jgi:hypothetical protein